MPDLNGPPSTIVSVRLPVDAGTAVKVIVILDAPISPSGVIDTLAVSATPALSAVTWQAKAAVGELGALVDVGAVVTVGLGLAGVLAVGVTVTVTVTTGAAVAVAVAVTVAAAVGLAVADAVTVGLGVPVAFTVLAVPVTLGTAVTVLVTVLVIVAPGTLIGSVTVCPLAVLVAVTVTTGAGMTVPGSASGLEAATVGTSWVNASGFAPCDIDASRPATAPALMTRAPPTTAIFRALLVGRSSRCNLLVPRITPLALAVGNTGATVAGLPG